MKLIRGSLDQLADAELLLNEYCDAIGVIKRDAPGAIVSYLSDDASGFWIAYVGEYPAGCVALRPLPSLGSATECKRLYVRPQFRGRGIAEALLNAMEEYALAIAADWIYLDSKDNLEDALRIYKKRGYRSCERYNDNPQATTFLRKPLRHVENIPL